ncbi:hypothetical protein [Aureispira anguillae]|uniref:Uncharacterized protein n=1 Tax=Aureispira anguillae TaxID=2864201 RepID=A0A916DSD9_9BACT|nr:hypothetical protein [Aureispira anguillae]BDS10751.1 hypothetical protein AsAng_0014600 [Aureispira anguillae]
MLSKTSVPLKKIDQRFLLLRSLLFLILSTGILYLGIKWCPHSLFIYPHQLSRVPKVNPNAPLLFIGLFVFCIGISIKGILRTTVYHFQLHTDVLIIVRQTLLHKKIAFIDLEKINHISFDKVLIKLDHQEDSLINYELTKLSIQIKDQKTLTYLMAPSYYELKALKKVFKNWLKSS